LKIGKHTITASLAIVILLLAGAAIWMAIDSVIDEQDHSQQAILALCAFKDSLRAQIDTAWQFLDEYPNGTNGISSEVVAREIEDKTVTLDLISPYLLNCIEIEGRG
jgi:hypothetical protein